MSRDRPQWTAQHETFMRSFPKEAVLARIKNNVWEYLEREQHTSARALYLQCSCSHIWAFTHHSDHLWKCACVPECLQGKSLEDNDKLFHSEFGCGRSAVGSFGFTPVCLCRGKRNTVCLRHIMRASLCNLSSQIYFINKTFYKAYMSSLSQNTVDQCFRNKWALKYRLVV